MECTTYKKLKLFHFVRGCSLFPQKFEMVLICSAKNCIHSVEWKCTNGLSELMKYLKLDLHWNTMPMYNQW